MRFLWWKFSLSVHTMKNSKVPCMTKQEVDIGLHKKIAYIVCPNYIKTHTNLKSIHPFGSWDNCDEILRDGMTDRQGDFNITIHSLSGDITKEGHLKSTQNCYFIIVAELLKNKNSWQNAILYQLDQIERNT